MRKSMLLIIVLLPFVLTQCALNKPVDLGEQRKYELSATVDKAYSKAAVEETLLVTTAVASPVYQSTQMLYLLEPYQLRAFTLNQWIAPPAQMLAPLIVESLANTGHYHAVVLPPYIGTANLLLDVKLVRLQQEFLTYPSVVVMEWSANLINAQNNELIASRQFTAVVPTTEESPRGGVLAANQATVQLLGQLTSFAVMNS